MEDKQKNKIANALFFIGKIYVISFVIILVLAIILSDKPQRVGGEISWYLLGLAMLSV